MRGWDFHFDVHMALENFNSYLASYGREIKTHLRVNISPSPMKMIVRKIEKNQQQNLVFMKKSVLYKGFI